MSDDTTLIEALRGISTNSLAGVLLRKGVRNIWVRGPRPMRADFPRTVGPAFTLRFIPARADASAGADTSARAGAKARTTRDVVEQMPKGCMVVADARGVRDVATFGDIVVTRMSLRGVAGIVTDGAVRDSAGLLATGLPIWTAGLTAPPPVAGHNLAGSQEPISCGGVAVFPNDMIVADADGVVVVPAAMAQEIAQLGAELEVHDEALLARVKGGETMDQLYRPKKP